jgi:hypothetical protein
MKACFLIAAMIISFQHLFGQELYKVQKGIESRLAGPENPDGLKGQGGKSNASAKGSAFTSIKAGETKTLLNVKTSGRIQRLWFTIEDRGPKCCACNGTATASRQSTRHSATFFARHSATR